ncbi:hypothetical protein QBC45DRAFT_453702 [Copromyces sp. CBS 386.78]|nr:hypothetical protein QBC45DRAFT_453702 [Copromyces sp. CBS 386.78]
MSSLPPDPWQVLGIAKTADKTEIRTAYRKLVLKCHPDKVQDPTLKAEKQDEFQKVQQAYELLNNDEERAKYEHQVRMNELNQQKTRAASKSAAHSPAARSSPRHKEFAFTPTPERSSHRTTTSSREKMYSQPSRSHEEVLTARFADMNFNEERRARRATSYEKQPRHEDERPSRREEEKTFRREDERPVRREEEKPLRREEERLKDKRRDEEEKKARRQREWDRQLEEIGDLGRKAEKKKTDKERDRAEKERKVDEKSRRHKGPSIEVVEDPEEPYKSDKKSAKSSSKKHPETKERERSREYDNGREKSAPRPTAGFVADDPLETAKRYMMSKGTKLPELERIPKLGRAQTYSYKTEVPRPPQADYDDEEVQRSSARPRRSSHETPTKSNPHIVDASPRLTPVNVKASKSPGVPLPQVSPLRRSHTEVHSGHQFQPPPMTRHTTWAPSSDRQFDNVYHNDSDDDYNRRHRSRYADSPSDGVRYKADGGRSSRRDEPTYPKVYSRGTSATRVPPDLYGPPRIYSTSGMNVKEGKRIDLNDVKFSDHIPYGTRSHPPPPRDYSYPIHT